MALIPPILCTLIGQGASLLMLVLIVASAPNSTKAQEATLKAWATAVVCVSVGALIAAIWLMVVRRPLTATAAALVPAAFCTIVFIIMLRTP